jgi:hypothetical protein
MSSYQPSTLIHQLVDEFIDAQSLPIRTILSADFADLRRESDWGFLKILWILSPSSRR